jgi:hypothetical protein
MLVCDGMVCAVAVDMTETIRRQCTRCGRKHLGEWRWLELNSVTGLYDTPGRVPIADSQGLFAFGLTCYAKQVITDHGGMSLSGRATLPPD